MIYDKFFLSMFPLKYKMKYPFWKKKKKEMPFPDIICANATFVI